MEAFRRAFRNEYVKTATMIILTLVVVLGFWQGLKLALRTEYPTLVVVSGSMLPTLNVGDLVIVQGASPAEINADPLTGDVVVFRYGSPDYRVVHRAIGKELVGGSWRVTTHGDNNSPGSNEYCDETTLIGKVVLRIPYIGNISLFTQSQGYIYFVIVAIILIIVFLIFLGADHEKQSDKQEPHEKRRLFGKLDTRIIYFTILNVLLIIFAVFNLWGAYAFWQPGAEQMWQNVTIYGMYSDLRFQADFSRINQAYLSQGPLTYRIDAQINGAIRSGVQTFSWYQASILVLLIYDVWIIINFVKSRKAAKTTTATLVSSAPLEPGSDTST
jgi:signal peptidase